MMGIGQSIVNPTGASGPSKLVNPLDKCFIGCHPGHQTIFSGLYGVARNGGKRVHCGIDLYAEPNKTKCLAIGDGYLIASGEMKDKGNGNYGLYLLYKTYMANNRPIWAFYAHLSNNTMVKVSKNKLITAGTPIGLTGVSGVPDTWLGKNFPHLHFEIWTTPDFLKVLNQSTPLRYRMDPMNVLPFVSVAPILEKMEMRA